MGSSSSAESSGKVGLTVGGRKNVPGHTTATAATAAAVKGKQAGEKEDKKDEDGV